MAIFNSKHLRALLKKNWIYWKRQYLISAAEIICPILLMLIILIARQQIGIKYITEEEFYRQAVVDKLDLTPEQWDVVGPLIEEELKFPKVNYMLYPMYYKKGYSAEQLIAYEQINYSFLSYEGRARNQIDPGPCSKRDPLQTQLGLWSYQYQTEYGYFIDFKALYFNSEEQMMEYVAHPQYEKESQRPGLCAGVSHYPRSDAQGHEFKIHLTDQNLDDRQLLPSQSDPATDRYNTDAKIQEFVNYNKNFYSYFHNWLANAVLRDVTGLADATIVNLIMQMKVDKAEIDQFDYVVSYLMPIAVTLIYIMPIHRMIMRIVTEKQTKVREVMRMMGLSDVNYWLSWFIFYSSIVTIISIFFIQSLFTNPRTASVMSILIYFFTSFADYAVNSNYVDEHKKIMASILPTIGMARALGNVAKFERAKIGLTIDNVGELYNNYRVLTAYYMFIIGLLLSFIFGIYFTNVLPTTPDGLRKVWYYPFKKSFWWPSKKVKRINQILNDSSGIFVRREEDFQSKEIDKSQHRSLRIPHEEEEPSPLDSSNYHTNQQAINSNMRQNERENMESQRSPRQSLINLDSEIKGINPQNYEPVDQQFAYAMESQNKILRITNLQKTYANGFTAVKGLNVKMYNSQIFALLGHNGADMQEDIEQVRQFLGVCPQHDILFDLLTPEEHLDIFCDFKGVSKKEKKQQISKMLDDVGVLEHKDKEARNLSGGNKRKLSVAIALIGGSKLVLLDEPTAGMDLTARRKLWNMLKDYKQNRIIILTTHYMDEADILGDRIGIMTGGKLTCIGSSLFLKNRYGVGYNLTINKKNKDTNDEIQDYLIEKLGDIKILSQIQSEMSFQIPYTVSHKFKDFFDNFDRDLDKLGIKSYGVSVTTLEEVFLKVGQGDQLDNSRDKSIQNKAELENEKIQDDYSIADDAEKGTCNIFCGHLGALLKKRTQIYKRNYKGLIVEILVPVILVILGFAFSKVQFFINSPGRPLTTNLVPHKQRMIVNSNLIRTTDYSGINLSTTEEEKPLIRQYDSDVFQASLKGSQEPYRYGSYFIYEADRSRMRFKTLTLVNLTSQDAAAFYPHFLYQAIIRAASGKPNYHFDVTTKSFPVTAFQKTRSAQVSGIFIVVVVAIAFSLIPAVIISFILSEKEKKIKHLQLISGMSLPAYWTSNMIFDIVKSMIPCGIIVGLIYAFNVEYDHIWILFLIFPIGTIPFTYATSFFFESENVAQTTTIFLHFIIGGIGSILVGVLRIIESTYVAADRLMWVFKIIPTFCLTEPIVYQTMKNQMFTLRPDLIKDDLSFEAIGGDIYFMLGHGVLWTVVLILLECRVFQCVGKFYDRIMSARLRNRNFSIQTDEDVKEEESRVSQTQPDQMNVRVDSFRKVYTKLFNKPFLAVEKTSFGLDYGECFALLGVNGAGKTTTFKSLTGECLPTQGSISINGLDIQNDFNKIRKLVGYCPQHDAIFEFMTVQEHLFFYAKIKGIKKNLIADLVERQIRRMNLNDHRHKLAGNLSGGNKRKLSVAICVIGNPPIILLDEPSAGMDPEARRFMWSVVAKISQQRKKSAVILTTHSMEEAEALSTKMGIMIQGGIFRCYGSSQHIKNKFGTGYEIEIKIHKLTNDELKEKTELYGFGDRPKVAFEELPNLMRKKMINEFVITEMDFGGLGNDLYKEQLENGGEVSSQNFINWLFIEQNGVEIIKQLCDKFGEVDVLEHYNDYYKLRVPRSELSIGKVFSLIENQKEQFKISEYSASQTTLEQIFQKFANQVTEDKSKIIRYRQRGRQIIRLKDHELGVEYEKPAEEPINNFNLSLSKPDV
eukprot:403351411